MGKCCRTKFLQALCTFLNNTIINLNSVVHDLFLFLNLYCFHVSFPWNPSFKGFFSPQICNKTTLNILTIHLFSHKLSDFPHTFTDLLHLNICKHTLEPMNKTAVLHRLISQLPLYQSLSILTPACSELAVIPWITAVSTHEWWRPHCRPA